jgi:hypothetical protein
MSERPLIFEDFADKVGHSFAISEEGVPAIALELRKADPLSPALAPRGMRPPFSLTFFAKDQQVLPQRIYRMRHETLGEVSIFIVPAAKDAEGVLYQATFN